MLLGFLAYKVSQFDYEMSNFDPYEILGLPPGATQAEIKKSYRKQSLILHPDKETGDEKAFMKLTKAYQVINKLFNLKKKGIERSFFYLYSPFFFYFML